MQEPYSGLCFAQQSPCTVQHNARPWLTNSIEGGNVTPVPRPVIPVGHLEAALVDGGASMGFQEGAVDDWLIVWLKRVGGAG